MANDKGSINEVIDLLLYGTDGQEYELDNKIVHFEGIVGTTMQYSSSLLY